MNVKKPLIYSTIITTIFFVVSSIFLSTQRKYILINDLFSVFILSIVITSIVFNRRRFSSAWQNLSYAQKGATTGIIITIIIVLFPSYITPIREYNKDKMLYTGYNNVIQNCGNNPSDECLKSLCEVNGSQGFCEGVDRKINGECGKISNLPERFCDWHTYTRSERPSIVSLMIPDIKDGLLFIGNFLGIYFFIILLSFPTVVGFVIGKMLKVKN